MIENHARTIAQHKSFVRAPKELQRVDWWRGSAPKRYLQHLMNMASWSLFRSCRRCCSSVAGGFTWTRSR